MRAIRVRYHAIMREQRGLGMETIKTNAGNVQKLYEQLKACHHFTVPEKHLKVAVNDRFVDWNKKLKSGDTVMFIPPVAGG